jgi:hypothetical protein
MAKVLRQDADRVAINILLLKTLQSGNINLLVGSGASRPAIKTAGNIEKEIDDLFKAEKPQEANRKIYELLIDVQLPNNCLIAKSAPLPLEDESYADYQERCKAFEETKQNYAELIRILERILIQRKSSLLPKQVNIFTTNYDLFVENAADQCPAIKLNDGFARTPNLQSRYAYSAQVFFNSTFNNGNLYNYKVEIPNINLR